MSSTHLLVFEYDAEFSTVKANLIADKTVCADSRTRRTRSFDPLPVIGARRKSNDTAVRSSWLVGKEAEGLSVVQWDVTQHQEIKKQLIDRDLLMTGLVLEILKTAAADLFRLDSIDVLAIGQHFHAQVDGSGKYPWPGAIAPWFGYALRRMRVKGRAAATPKLSDWARREILERGNWKDLGQRDQVPTADDGDAPALDLERDDNLFLASWFRINETPVPYPVVTEAFGKKTPIVSKSEVPPLRAQVALSIDKTPQDYCINILSQRVSEGDDLVKSGFVLVDLPVLTIMIKPRAGRLGERGAEVTAELSKSSLASANPRGGLTQTLDIDRFGRVYLTYRDDEGRAIPLILTKCAAQKSVSRLYVANLFFPGYDETAPQTIAATSFNGGPCETAADDITPYGREVEPLLIDTAAFERLLNNLLLPQNEERLKGILHDCTSTRALYDNSNDLQKRAKTVRRRLIETCIESLPEDMHDFEGILSFYGFNSQGQKEVTDGGRPRNGIGTD
ncbi:hypothetical protein [Roseibium album]|uniref:Uncharacterized protein n=1 Tax=Roseibium album TaxID=311410 RepID=A0A0M6Z6W7_9HYPH|nr:hypothetical protein [Roseibium album]CTQ58469.1 hypothetical protein LA5094_01230 [Roseibium album]CTQ66552.1 hypothetical protein LA5096_01141 [Roseibium album]CTQ71653.1 hypothetical protein LA5095_02285 [Roseibium album]